MKIGFLIFGFLIIIILDKNKQLTISTLGSASLVPASPDDQPRKHKNIQKDQLKQ
jgi:hypothetical protein